MIYRIFILLIVLSPSVFGAQESVESDFFRNPEFVSPRVNGNGEFFLAKKKVDSSYEVVLTDLTQLVETPIFRISQSSSTYISNFSWLGDESFSISTYDSHRGGKLYLYKLQSDGKTQHLTTLEHTYLFDAQIAQEDKFIAFRYKHGNPHLFLFDLTDDHYESQFRNKRRITKGPLKDGQWLIDNSGRTHVNFEKKDGEIQVYVRQPDSKKWEKVWQHSDDIQFKPVMFTPEKNELLVLSQKDGGYTRLYRFNTETRDFTDTVYQINGRDITNVLIDPFKSDLIGYTYIQGGVAHHVYNKTLSELVDRHTKTTDIPDGYVTDFSEDYRKSIYINSSVDSPSRYYLYDQETNKSMLIGEERPWLNEYSLGASQVITSKSSDGVEIESYLTLPTNTDKKQFPLLVMPHGGPLGVSDNRHFPIDVHYFVQKGYAVLTPNYRGSSGFGEKFLNAGKQQWGRLIEDDIESAVAKVIDDGFIDDSKICIFGISYGGYSALISAIRRPDLYRCAISYAGVTDIPLLFSGGNAQDHKDRNKVLVDILGDPDKSWDTLINYSPVYRADELTIPVLIAQGGRDRIVDDEHFFRMKYVLEKLDKDFQYVYLENEIHGFKKTQSQISLYIEINKFIEKSFMTTENPGSNNEQGNSHLNSQSIN